MKCNMPITFAPILSDKQQRKEFNRNILSTRSIQYHYRSSTDHFADHTRDKLEDGKKRAQ